MGAFQVSCNDGLLGLIDELLNLGHDLLLAGSELAVGDLLQVFFCRCVELVRGGALLRGLCSAGFSRQLNGGLIRSSVADYFLGRRARLLRRRRRGSGITGTGIRKACICRLLRIAGAIGRRFHRTGRLRTIGHSFLGMFTRLGRLLDRVGGILRLPGGGRLLTGLGTLCRLVPWLRGRCREAGHARRQPSEGPPSHQARLRRRRFCPTAQRMGPDPRRKGRGRRRHREI